MSAVTYAPEIALAVLAVGCWVVCIREYRAVIRREAEFTARDRGQP